MPGDNLILSEIKKAIRRFANSEIVDMDAYFNHKFEFEVFRYEEVMSNTQRSIPPNQWSYHRMGLIIQGTGEFTSGIYKYAAKADTLVVIPSRMITSSRNWSMDMRGYFLLFNSDFFLQQNFPPHFIESKKIL